MSFEFEIHKNPTLEIAKELWKEGHTDSQFFLSWHWVQSWLVNCANRPMLLVGRNRSQVVTLCFISELNYKKFGLFSTKKLVINNTGLENRDQVWVEYNRLSLSNSDSPELNDAIFSYLDKALQWDEISIGASLVNPQFLSLEKSDAFLTRRTWQAKGYKVELENLQKNAVSYLENLSKNTRYQINRSNKSFSKDGTMSFRTASTLIEAQQWMRELSRLHIKYWNHKGVKSGFENEYFRNFHDALLEQSFSKGVIDICKLSTGARVVGYLYNFVYNNNVYFYLSAFNYNFENKHEKPGLTTHTTAIEYYLSQGFHSYDFLGGDAQYKKSLSQKEYELAYLLVQKKRWIFKLENKLRRVKAMLSFNIR